MSTFESPASSYAKMKEIVQAGQMFSIFCDEAKARTGANVETCWDIARDWLNIYIDGAVFAHISRDQMYKCKSNFELVELFMVVIDDYMHQKKVLCASKFNDGVKWAESFFQSRSITVPKNGPLGDEVTLVKEIMESFDNTLVITGVFLTENGEAEAQWDAASREWKWTKWTTTANHLAYDTGYGDNHAKIQVFKYHPKSIGGGKLFIGGEDIGNVSNAVLNPPPPVVTDFGPLTVGSDYIDNLNNDFNSVAVDTTGTFNDEYMISPSEKEAFEEWKRTHKGKASSPVPIERIDVSPKRRRFALEE